MFTTTARQVSALSRTLGHDALEYNEASRDRNAEKCLGCDEYKTDAEVQFADFSLQVGPGYVSKCQRVDGDYIIGTYFEFRTRDQLIDAIQKAIAE